MQKDNGLARRLAGLDQMQLRAAADSLVVILPFSVRGGQSDRYLREGVADLLSAALDGAGSLRPVDNRAVFAAMGQPQLPPSDPRLANRIARQLGAGRYVAGEVFVAGHQIQIDVGVYSAEARCASRGAWSAWLMRCPPREPLARAVVSGDVDSVFALVDRVAARLLGGLGDAKADRLLRTAALTTATLDAFKAYIDGERFMRAGEFERAADSYLAAIALDSTFAMAYYRLGLAREWAPLPGETDAADAAARHADRLSPRDRALLEAFRAWRSGDAAGGERAYRSILARYPDDVDAWFQLAEILFHQGPLLGHVVGESEMAWRRVLAYEPTNPFAVTHLARIAVIHRRHALLDSLLSPFTETERENDRRLMEPMLFRAVSRHDTAAAIRLARRVRQWEPLAIWRVAVFLTAFSPDPSLMDSVVAVLADELPASDRRADLLWLRSLLNTAGGRVGAAERSLAAAIEIERRTPDDRTGRSFAELTTWFAATLPLPYPDTLLVRVQRAVTAASPVRGPSAFGPLGFGGPIQFAAVRQYTVGVLAARLDDMASARRAAVSLHQMATVRSATSLSRDLDRGLRARLAWQAGNAPTALGILDSLESRDSQGDVVAMPFVSRASERYLRGLVLTALGHDAEALRWFDALGNGSVTEMPLGALASLRRAEIYDRLGQPDSASAERARTAALWRAADPGFRDRGGAR